MLEIDPKDSEQRKENDVVEIIDGRDKVRYKLTKESPLVKGHSRHDGVVVPGQHRVGEKHWGHPIIVDMLVKRKWAEIISGTLVKHEMPKPEGKK